MVPGLLQATEGMWIPMLLKSLNEAEMQSMGLKLSAEDIYAVNKSSLKDAIVHFGGGCTAEVVSSKGLIFTNHHCGFSQIQSHSSVEKDYLTHGFWAMKQEEELPNPGLTATLIVRIEDVTERVMQGGSPADAATIERNIAKIKSEIKANEKNHEAEVKPFFYGNAYYLIVTKTYRDVRLVGAPPGGVGKFGGDTDNWMWPRHTGDFSVFRIYAGKDNEPAEYSPENVPYKPAHHFPVNAKGIKQGDFTMVYGFPGQTQQYLHSSAVKFIVEELNPRTVGMRDQSLAIIGETMRSSDALRIAYAAKQARIANAWKKWIGESKGLERLDALQVKRDLERQFNTAIQGNDNWKSQFGNVTSEIQKLQESANPYNLARAMMIEFYFMGPEILRYIRNFEGVVDGYEKMAKDGSLEAELAKLRAGVAGFFKNWDVSTDKQIMAVLWPMYLEGLRTDLRPEIAGELQAKYGGDWRKMAEELYAKSPFSDKTRLESALDKFNASTVKKLRADGLYRLGKSVMSAWRDKAMNTQTGLEAQMQGLMKTYVKGLMTVFPDKRYWPDANSTLRVTYGKVEGSEPSDGVVYKPFCTMDGVLEKYIPGDEEFDIPVRLAEMARKRDFGPYADQNGDLVVAFTASNHTTGGNSGSPVLDGEGHLVGINFDRSWESTMSDVMYDPTRCRNIIVDARYVLFVIDRYAGAQHLIDEMTIVR